jgi:hypothetical protein
MEERSVHPYDIMQTDHNYLIPNLSAMQNPELNATILALEIQLSYFEKKLDQSIREDEDFARSKQVFQDLKKISTQLKFLKKLHAAEQKQAHLTSVH